MIRRNHTDKNIFSDKYALKYRSKQPEENYLMSRDVQRKQLEHGYDENLKVVSNNKKYHQYKQEKELKIKNHQNQSKNACPAQVPPLAESIYEPRNRPQPRAQTHLLKRQYHDEPKENKKEQNIRVQRLLQEKLMIRKSQQEQQKRNKLSLNYSYDCSPERIAHKEKQIIPQNTVKYEPTRLQHKRVSIDYRSSFKKERSQSVSINFSKRRQLSSQHYFKTDYDPAQLQRKSDKHYFDQMPSRPHPLRINSKEAKQIQRAVAPPCQIGQEQVCLKLKQISQFNSEINQRIKGIIGSFQSMKSKL